MASSILVNGKWKAHPNTTGVQRYAQELVNSFEAQGFNYTLSKPVSSNKYKNMLWEQFLLARESKRYDTLFCPANMAPIILPDHVRLIMTLHCLRFYFHPENYSPAFVAWYRMAINQIIHRASVILTVSNTTAADINRVYPASMGKVQVVYPGVSSHFQKQANDRASTERPYPYFVFVGNASQSKNLMMILHALNTTSIEHHLVLIGVSKEQLHRTMSCTKNLQRRSKYIHPVGHINDAHQVAEIIRGATALLAPSLYESFDLPLAEAMACNTPVLASDTPVHREIGGDAPTYLPSDNPRVWGQAMDKLQTDDELCEFMMTKGLDRAEHFHWNMAAQSIMGILEQ